MSRRTERLIDLVLFILFWAMVLGFYQIGRWLKNLIAWLAN